MKWSLVSILALAWLAAAAPAAGKVGAEQAARLDSDELTCMGAERGGNADGTVPAYTGKWVDRWPGMKHKNGYEPGPYADEKPLFVITAQNMQAHAERLTAGQKVMLQRYPRSFRIPVYPSHRDFAYPAWVCDVVKKNAVTAELANGGLGFTGTTGGITFPFPQNGLEAQWNIQNPHRAWTEEAVLDQAVVYRDGGVAWGRVGYRILSVWNDPHRRGSNQDRVNSYFDVETLLPEREKGTVIIGWTPNDTSLARMAYMYNPGIRRVRLAPEFGFDTPQGAGGFRTVDDDRLFNGSPIRYDWKVVGKKEIYVPYNVFRVNDPAVKYRQLLTPNTLSPDFMRYELHRVWVLEATVKKGYRHVYKRRVIYVDEDTWHPIWADTYDGRDQLWRVSLINYFWSPAMQAYHAGVSIYHDLTADAYFADRLVNESKVWWKVNAGDLKPEMFAPEVAKRRGH